MKAVNVRQLKNNPSEALREARNQPVIVLRGDQPEAVLLHLGDDSLLAEPGLRLALATSLYRDASLSLGQAARFAGLPIAGLIQHLSRLGIPVVRGTIDQVSDDAVTVREWRSESSRLTPVH